MALGPELLLLVSPHVPLSIILTDVDFCYGQQNFELESGLFVSELYILLHLVVNPIMFWSVFQCQNNTHLAAKCAFTLEADESE